MYSLDKFILDYIREGKQVEPSLRSYIQSLEENLNKIQPKTVSESRRVEMAKEQIRGIRRHARRLEERLNLLEGENKTLKEQMSLFEQTTKETEE